MRKTLLIALAIIACAAAACSGGGDSKSTPKAGSPTAQATASPNSPAAGGATAAASIAASGGFPARCSSLVTGEIDALAAQHLQLAPDAAAATSGATSQLVCRFQGAGTAGDSAIIVVAARYADATTATREDRISRATAEAQGGKFTALAGVEDEAYSFVYPSVTGVAARRGRATLSIGVGKLLGVPASAEFNALIKSLLTKLGS